MMNTITLFLTGSSLWVYIFIFVGKMIEVALASLRTLMITKGQRVAGAVVAIFEYAIWLCITGTALTGISSDPLKMIVLIAAFALGQILGSWLEEKIALGYTTLTVIFSDTKKGNISIKSLRRDGYAITTLQGEGRDCTCKTIAVMVIQRKCEKKVKKFVRSCDEKAVINSSSSNGLSGGMIPGRK